MTAMNEFQALTTSIGEFSVDALGKENLTGLQIALDPREMSGFITIALEDPSNEAQRAAIETMFEVERMYRGEVALTYVFVQHIDDTVESTASVPQFSYA